MSDMTWIEVGPIDGIPHRGARVVQTATCDVAIFRTADDRIFALEDRCPHSGGPLSQGIVHDHKVTCPLHDWIIDLMSGAAQGADRGCARTVDVKADAGRVYLRLPTIDRKAA